MTCLFFSKKSQKYENRQEAVFFFSFLWEELERANVLESYWTNEFNDYQIHIYVKNVSLTDKLLLTVCLLSIS